MQTLPVRNDKNENAKRKNAAKWVKCLFGNVEEEEHECAKMNKLGYI